MERVQEGELIGFSLLERTGRSAIGDSGRLWMMRFVSLIVEDGCMVSKRSTELNPSFIRLYREREREIKISR